MTDPTSRALALLGLLEARRSWSGPELAERLGVTTRTLRRDIDRLRSLGYRIDADPGVDGGYALGRSQVIPPLLLDDDEALAVTMALLSATARGTAVDGDAALRALGKLDDVLPAATREQARQLRRSIHVVGGIDAVHTDPTVLSRIAAVTRRHQRVRFRYVARDDTTTERYVEPHLLVAKDERWYVLCYDLERADWRTFRLDRIDAVDPTTWEFKPRPDLPDARARMAQGMPAEAYRYRVEVRYAAPLADVVEAMPGFSGMLTADGEATLMRTGADDPDSAAWWILRVPFPCTVLGDADVRAAFDRLRARLR